MPTLLYGLTLAGEPTPRAGAGVGDAPVRELTSGGLRAIVSTVPGKPSPAVETIRQHDRVLREYVRAGATVAAVRFGQLFEDDAACLGEIPERASRIEVLLREHQGCVEMRVLLPAEAGARSTAPSEPVGPGRAYLESLRARGTVSPGLALAPVVGPSIRAERVEGFASPSGEARGVAFAHLVHRDDLAAYREALQSMPSLEGARVVGPLPLYSFAEPER
ncbi:MAG TPA: GvpL/GvpF family gas vesicle protein [Gemmatimonadaceae bacterium]|nr:GvpL/GvpF family gas vesicle protein [Gemmatimonadaceae bacterium]